MLKQIFLDIEAKLKEITDDGIEPYFKHFDLWNRQVEFMELETGLSFPAIFIEFFPLDWHNQAQKIQDADLAIRLHIVTEWYADSADNTPQPFRDKSLAVLDIENRVFCTLQHFAPTNCNRFMRTKTTINHDHETHIDTQQEYVCHVTDTSAGIGEHIYINVDTVVKPQK